MKSRDKKNMPPTQRKYYLCNGQSVTAERLATYPHSHIIGELIYTTDEGRRVTALAQYIASRKVADIPAQLPATRCHSIGDTRHILCTLCNRRPRWEAGQAAIEAIIQRATRDRHAV